MKLQYWQFPLSPPPLKLVFEKNLVFEIWTETGVMKKFSEIGGLVEKGEGGGTLRKAGGPHCFISFPKEKYFVTAIESFVW